MWYSYKNETTDSIDYSYLDCLFDNEEETNDFLKIFVKELETAKVAFLSAIANRNTETFRQTYHNVSPHLEILKINNLLALLQQVRVKLLAIDQPFEDQTLFMNILANAFDTLTQEIQNKITKNS